MSRDWPDAIQVQTRDAANGFAASYDWDAIDREKAKKEFHAREKEIIDSSEARRGAGSRHGDGGGDVGHEECLLR